VQGRVLELILAQRSVLALLVLVQVQAQMLEFLQMLGPALVQVYSQLY
jgi:hypothetical protein